MKTTNLFRTIAVAATVALVALTSCEKEPGTKNSAADKFKVTIALQNAVNSRADGAAAVAGTKVDIDNGYVCFVSSANSITDVYTISSAATAGKNIRNTDLGAVAVVLDNVPGASQKVYMITNKGTLAAVPTVGNSIAAYLNNNMDVKDQADYTKVTAVGQATLTGPADHKVANIVLATRVARIQVKNLTFDGAITAGQVAGIFINGFYVNMELDGTAGTRSASANKADYVAGSAIFKTELQSKVYDIVGKNIATTVAPNTVGGVWGYNLFESATPQIIIKLTGVTANGQALTEDQFVTVNGFKTTGATPTEIATLRGGMIYTIGAGALVIKPEHLSVDPGTTPFKVDVTVERVEWEETPVTPNL